MSLLLNLIFPRRCYGCSRTGNYICPRCLQNITRLSARQPKNSLFEGVISCFRYHTVIRQVLVGLKFDFVTDLTNELSDLVSSEIIKNYPNILKYWQEKDFVLIPVPLHPFRQNWRGFNQTAILFKKISLKLHLRFNDNILLRIQNTQPQTRIKDKNLRRQNTSNAFTLLANNYQNIILCDDVYTTGSTIKSAASVFPPKTNLWALTVAG